MISTSPIVIFVRPQAPGNIGAVARAMSNFNTCDLRLCGAGVERDSPEDDPFRTMDWALAKRGESILKNSTWYPDLKTAINDIHLVIGTSGRDVEFERGYARPHVDPKTAFSTVKSWQSKIGDDFKWALVLGPEDDGLCDDEAGLCQKLIRIPTADLNPSLNVAMAAGCLLYQFYSEFQREPVVETENLDGGAFLNPDRAFARLPATETDRSEWATQGEREAFLNYLMNTLACTQFLKYPDTESVQARVRRWLLSAPIPRGELLFAFEILYHLKAWGTGKFEKRDFFKEL